MKTKKNLFAVTLLFASCFLLPTTIFAQSGSLDNTFSLDGIVSTDLGGAQDNGNSVAIQSDGKIVLAGDNWNGSSSSPIRDFAIVRYNSDGTLDLSFDTDGRVTTDFIGGYVDYGRSVAIQNDGKIVVAGYMSTGSDYDFALARYNSDGSLDNTLDADGKATTNIFSTTNPDYAYAMIIQNDGKIIVAGTAFDGAYYTFALVRYNSDGTLDNTFDTDGKVTNPWGSEIRSVAIQSDGKIVVAGIAGTDFGLVRFNSDGTVDNTFGSGGGATTNFGANYLGSVGSMKIQSDGKIVVAGTRQHTLSSADRDFALVRYNSDGTLDLTFDIDGIVTTDFGGLQDYGSSATLQTDGKIIVSGSSFNGANTNFALARYNTDGSLDNTFGFSGILTTDFGNVNDAGNSVALQSDGKIVVGGGSNGNFAAARYIVCSAISFSQSPTVCYGQSVTVGSNIYNASGTYQDTLVRVGGCDSVVTTNLTVLPSNTFTQSPTVCAGQNVTVGINIYNVSGTYSDTLTSAVNGCDSVVTTNLTVLPANTFTQSPTVCAGQSVTVGSNIYNVSGTYIDTLTSAVNGCDSIVTTNLTVNSLPTVVLSLNPTSVCLDDAAFALTGGSPISGIYSGTGVSGGNFDPGLANSGSHTIVYTYTDANGCTGSDSAQITVNLCAGVNQLANTSMEFSIYPNPNNGMFTISNFQSPISSLEIYNLLGETVFSSTNINQTSFDIDISSSPKGIYFVKIAGGEENGESRIYSNKIIIQ